MDMISDVFFSYLSSGPKGFLAAIGMILVLIGTIIGFLSAVIHMIASIAGAEYSQKQFRIGGLIMIVGLLMFLIFGQ